MLYGFPTHSHAHIELWVGGIVHEFTSPPNPDPNPNQGAPVVHTTNLSSQSTLDATWYGLRQHAGQYVV